MRDASGQERPLNDAERAASQKAYFDWKARGGKPTTQKPAASEKTEGGESEGQESQQQEPREQQTVAEGHDLEVPAEVPQQFFEQTEANIQQASAIAAELGVPREEARG